MKSIVLRVLHSALKQLSRITIWRFRPGIIGVTGSVGKTSAKLAIAAVLGNERRVRSSEESHNNQFGLPLSIIGEWSPEQLKLVSKMEPPGVKRFQKALFWVTAIAKGIFQIIVKRSGYPEILVLEYGVDRPGDIKHLVSIARPNISVITAIGDVPVHVEFFSGPNEVAREKARLIECLPAASFAVLNYDDAAVMNIKDRTRAHSITFGFSKGADVRISGFENRRGGGLPLGVSFKLEHGGTVVPVRLENIFGKTQAYAAGAAACIGLIFGMNLVKISDALQHYRPPRGRMQLLRGIKDARIIDDSYNASPLSMGAALDTLRDLPGRRKIAVLGDMLEIGEFAMEAHEKIGKIAAKFLDILVTVGPRAKFIAEGARAAGMKKSAVRSFDSADEAHPYVQEIMQKGDMILVKASRAMHLEVVVAEIAALEDAKHYLETGERDDVST